MKSSITPSTSIYFKTDFVNLFIPKIYFLVSLSLERKRFTNDEITEEDIKKLNETIDSLHEYNLDLEIDGLNIEI